MNSNRIWVIVAVAAIVAVLAGGWFLGAQPLLASAAAADLSSSSVESTNQGLQVKLASLARLGARAESMKSDQAALQKAVPEILKPNTFYRRINEIAALHDVTVESEQTDPAQPYTVPASAAGATSTAAATTTTDGAAPTPVPTETASAATTTTTTTTPTAPKLALTDPLVTPSNFVVIPATITVTGSKDAILAFSTAVQNDQRVFLVNSLTISAGEDTGDTGTLTGFIYALKR